MTDKDIDKKLKKMEEQLDVITSSLASRTPDSSFSNPDSRFPPLDSGFPAASRSDEIDLRELFAILWQGRWWIIGITFLFAVAGVLYALSLPNMYKSEGIYAPAQKQGGGALSGQLGGLASLAGVRLGGGESNDIEQAIALITSWPFLENLVDENTLAPYVLAIKGWSKATGDLIWNNEVYDENNSLWVSLESSEPTSYEVYHALSQMVEVKADAKTGMVSVSVTHYSPVVAEHWVRLLVDTVNKHFQHRDIIDAQRNISYLENKISQTSLAEMQAVFYAMIESQIKTLMLAEVGDEYLLKEVVPPKVAERKSKPAKAVICILFVILGGGLACSIVLICGLIRINKN